MGERDVAEQAGGSLSGRAQPEARPRSLRRRLPPPPTEGDQGPTPPPCSRGRYRASPTRASAGLRMPGRQQGRGVGRRGGGNRGFEATAGVGSMEDKRMSAILSRFLFGPLAFQHVNSEADTGGFLLGEVKREVKDNMTETQANDGDIVYTIDIRRYIVCSQIFRFYDSAGEVDEQALKKVISCCGKKVIGWYKYRSNSDQRMTCQEMMLHESIQKHVCSQKFVFLLLSPRVISESPFTHWLDYLLLHRTQEGLFNKVPLQVIDLNISEEKKYKTVSGSNTATTFCEIVLTHRSEIFDSVFKQVQKIRDLYGNIQEELKKIRTQVFKTEQLVETLLKDLSILKEELENTMTAMNLAPGV